MLEDELYQVQPIDGYVKRLLEFANREYNLGINIESPTRKQRLEAALKIAEAGVPDKHSAEWSAIEIMVGRRIDSSEEKAGLYAMLLLDPQKTADPREFYSGFQHDYWPKND